LPVENIFCQKIFHIRVPKKIVLHKNLFFYGFITECWVNILPPVDEKKRTEKNQEQEICSDATEARNSKGTEPFEKLGKKDGVVGCLGKGLKNLRYEL
jgi:hypothetical protein